MKTYHKEMDELLENLYEHGDTIKTLRNKCSIGIMHIKRWFEKKFGK